MKVAALLLFPSLLAAQPVGLPKITVLNPDSGNAIPQIAITFPDGHEDLLVLERHYFSESDRIAKKMNCNFMGHLEKMSEACVAVTGCIGQRMELTINSKHCGSINKFILHQNGEVEAVESPFKVLDFILSRVSNTYLFSYIKGSNEYGETLDVPQQLKEGEWKLVDGDEVVNHEQIADEMKVAANCAAGQCSSLPETNLMKIKVNYTNFHNTLNKFFK